jgi:Putative Ig domain/Subtilase family
VRTVLLTRHAVAVAAVAGLGVLGVSTSAFAAGAAPTGTQATRAVERPALPAGQHYVCPPAKPGQMQCMSIVRSVRMSGMMAAAGIKPAVNGQYTPTDLRKAYRLTGASEHRGKGRTIAIVDAFNDPKANADLKVYRSHFHLPACTTSNHCLRIVNQNGKAHPLPAGNQNWGVEISLDLDMVSAVCPKCHILLVEAKNNSTLNLGTAVNRAVQMGAKFVSNSWGGPEFTGENHFSHFFNHPGRVINFASGDLGFGATFPADLQDVTSVGGTHLVHKAGNGRGWAESVWGSASGGDGTASGCSNGQAKPSWQPLADARPNGCQTRTENDVSAVADPNTGVVVYDTFGEGGGIEVGGTSAATPIITGIYALAGSPKTRTYPAEYSYLRKGHLFDATGGANGSCGTYLCTGVKGFDGPTGLGTPNGITAFGTGSKPMVTIVDPGNKTVAQGAKLSVKLIGLDSAKVKVLHYSANGTLPKGLTIKSVAHSTNGLISGTVTAAPGTYHVAITARNGSAKGVTHFTIVVHA